MGWAVGTDAIVSISNKSNQINVRKITRIYYIPQEKTSKKQPDSPPIIEGNKVLTCDIHWSTSDKLWGGQKDGKKKKIKIGDNGRTTHLPSRKTLQVVSVVMCSGANQRIPYAIHRRLKESKVGRK